MTTAGRVRRGPAVLERVGRWTAAHPWRVLGAWLVLLVLAVLGSATFASRLTAQTNTVDGSGSAAASQMIHRAFPTAGAETDFVVLHSGTLTARSAPFADRVAAVVDRYRTAAGVRGVTGPYADPSRLVSPDGHTALVLVNLAGSAKDLQRAATPMRDLAGALDSPPVRVYFTGYSPLAAAEITQSNADLERAESIGFPVAAVVLVLAFGSLVAAAIPLTLGLTAILTSFGLLGAISFFLRFSTIAQSAVTMLAIALGIDYSLFIVTRFREELTAVRPGDRVGRAAAVGRAVGTAGRAVLFSGGTVMISLGGLFLVHSPSVRSMAVGLMAGVLAMMALSVTLLPALLGLLGHRVNRLALPWARASLAHPDPRRSMWARVATVMMRRPVAGTVGVVALLGLLAAPAFGMRYGVDTGVSALGGTPAGQGYALVSASFAPGLIAPISVVSASPHGALSGAQLDAVAAFTRDATRDARVAAVTSVTTVLDQMAGGHDPNRLAAAAARDPGALGSLVNPGRTTTIVTVYPVRAADSRDTQALVASLRAAVRRTLDPAGLVAYVGGDPAQIADISAENTRATPLVIGAVLVASWLLLLLVFRSLLLPFKAIAMNIVSVGAAFGAVVLVFQDGHGARLIGVDRTGFIQIMLPLLTFAVAFGLSMDYSVFMLSRMCEEWQRTGDNAAAVRLGITRTARVVTSAALIMVAVFASFTLAHTLETKQLGFMLAVAVLLDASVVRLLLVPALMRLLGRWNWWWPVHRDAPPPAAAPVAPHAPPARTARAASTGRD